MQYPGETPPIMALLLIQTDYQIRLQQTNIVKREPFWLKIFKIKENRSQYELGQWLPVQPYLEFSNISISFHLVYHLLRIIPFPVPHLLHIYYMHNLALISVFLSFTSRSHIYIFHIHFFVCWSACPHSNSMRHVYCCHVALL